ncbi:A disintegrin and metalloproteinase [Mactra antiquata]
MKVSDLSFLFIYLQTTYSLLVEETTQDDVIEYVTVYEVPGDHYRSKRFSDADFPTKFHFLLEMSTQNISMNLARSVPIEQKTPIYSINKNGGILKVKDGSQRQYGIYQDSILGASIIVSRQIRDIHNIELFGSFTVDGKHYQIEPMSPSLRTRRTAGLRSSKGNNVDNIKHRIRRQTNPYGDFLGDELLPPVDSAGLNRPPLMPPYPGDLITMGPYDIPIIQLQEDKPSVLQGQEVTTDSTRQRRDTSQTLYIEYMAVVDYKNLERWKTMVDGNTDQEKLDNAFNVMQKYYQFIVNGIDVRFRTATISGPTIRVNLTNILVSTEKSTSPWIENNMLSENSIDDAGVLLDFATWRKSMIQYLPRHDHAGLFTGFDLATPTSLNPIGMGYLNSICHNSWAVSEIEETYNAITVHIAAHELGHNIGTRHDGNGNSCQSSSLYLMAPRLPTIYDPSIRTNPWTFSTCSQNAIKTFIDGLGRGYSQLKKEELEKLIDEHSKMEAQVKRFLNYQQSIWDRPNPDIGVEPLKPTKAKTTVQKIKDTVKDTVIDWTSWLAEKTVPVIKKVPENLQKLKIK